MFETWANLGVFLLLIAGFALAFIAAIGIILLAYNIVYENIIKRLIKRKSRQSRRMVYY